MDLNLENISKINTGSSYYLSDNGEIKKSGLLHKFKCFFNLGHSRERVANLVNAIRNTLVTASEDSGRPALEEQLRNISTKSALQGSAIKQLADNFITANKTQILQQQSKKIAASKVNDVMDSLVAKSNGQIEKTEGLKLLLTSVIQKYIDNPPTTQKGGLTVVSQDMLQKSIEKDLSKLGNLLCYIAESQTLDKPKITNDYALYLKSALSDVIKGDISYEDFSIENLEKPDDAYAEVLHKKMYTKPDRNPEKQAVFDAFVKYTAEELKDDPELQSLVRKVGSYIIEGGDHKYRSFDSIKKKIEGIKTNIQELRELSVNNPKLMEVGKDILVALEGQSFPRGTIPFLMNFINSADLSDIEKINANSSSIDLHKAFLQLRSVMVDCVRQMPSQIKNSGEDLMASLRTMQMSLVLLKLNPQQRLNLLKGLESVNMSNLMNAYEIQGKIFADSMDVPDQFRSLRRETMTHVSFLTMDFYAILQGLTGTQPKNITASIGTPNKDLIAQIKTDILKEVDKEAKTKFDTYMDGHIKGEHLGFLKEKYRNIAFNSKFADVRRPFDPEELFSITVGKDIHNMNTWNIISSMISFSNGKLEDTSFFKDLSRLNININGKPMSTDPKTAMDQLAEYITKGKKNSFEALSAEEKNQVGVVIGMLSQETVKTITTGVPLGLSDNHDKPLFTTSGGPNSEKASFNLEITPFDDIRIICNYEQDATFIQHGGQDIRLNPGTKVKGKFVISIKPDELSRVGNLDYKSLDNTPAKNIFAEIGPENQGNNAHNKMQRIMDTFPEDYSPDLIIMKDFSIIEPD